MSGLARISQAWQLVESMRMVRSAEPLVWLCVCDSGFWWDASGGPGPGTRTESKPRQSRW